jgi:predicted nuclease of predicted toxin-antitoxin system
VALLGLERASDASLCDFADRHGFVICTKDDDFLRLVAGRGWRPRLVRLALGNVSNDIVLSALVASAARLHATFAEPDVGVVVIE